MTSWRLAFGIALLASCSGGAGGDCPNDLPAACPTPAPGFASQVSAIASKHCAKCHQPGGTGQAQDLTSYDGLFHYRSAVLNQVFACRMPPAGEPGLSDSERVALLGWLVCGAPNN